MAYRERRKRSTMEGAGQRSDRVTGTRKSTRKPFNFRIADEPLSIRKRYRGISFVPRGTTSLWRSRVRCYVTVDLERSGATMRSELLRFNGAVERDPAIDAW